MKKLLVILSLLSSFSTASACMQAVDERAFFRVNRAGVEALATVDGDRIELHQLISRRSRTDIATQLEVSFDKEIVRLVSKKVAKLGDDDKNELVTLQFESIGMGSTEIVLTLKNKLNGSTKSEVKQEINAKMMPRPRCG